MFLIKKCLILARSHFYNSFRTFVTSQSEKGDPDTKFHR